MAPKPTDESTEKVLSHQRRELIAAATEERGAVRVRELTREFGVSNMTIRRDIEALASANRLVRVHGGATRLDRPSRAVDEPGFHAKSSRQQDEKMSIAAAAAARIAPGSAIGVTAGTTTHQLAHHLTGITNLTVVTNSISIASTLSSVGSHDLQVVITGGSPTPSNAIVGPLADRTLSGLHLDQLFMGVHGMAEESGFTTPNLAEAQTNQAFIRSAREKVVIVDSTKWGVTGLGTIAPLTAADVLVTDNQLSAEARRVLDREVGELELVTPNAA